ncbi:MAG TPA: ion channel [Caulobacteraceae bacterium]|nr:ion channel [Caulobacteraceae bacterium]
MAMIVQLGLATAMVLATVLFHACGLAVLGRFLRLEAREEVARHVPSISARTLAFTMAVVLSLFVLHGLEIWSYAFLYLCLRAVQDLATAVYFSTITYAGIGFDDRYMTPEWRLVSAIEGVNGVLLLGWSTAFFVTVVTRLAGDRRAKGFTLGAGP